MHGSSGHFTPQPSQHTLPMPGNLPNHSKSHSVQYILCASSLNPRSEKHWPERKSFFLPRKSVKSHILFECHSTLASLGYWSYVHKIMVKTPVPISPLSLFEESGRPEHKSQIVKPLHSLQFGKTTEKLTTEFKTVNDCRMSTFPQQFTEVILIH